MIGSNNTFDSRARVRHPVLFFVILFLAVLGGLTALGHQVLWTRRMVDILGGTAESSSRVIGTFFLGLALGAACAAGIAGRIKRPWRLLAGLECLICLTVLPFLFLTPLMDWLWGVLGTNALGHVSGAFVKTAASFFGVFPAAFVMGWFLPLAAKGLFPQRSDFEKRGLWLYAVNTLGGVIGLVALSLWTLQSLGVSGSFFLLLGCHVLAIGGFLLADLVSGPVQTEPTQPERGTKNSALSSASSRQSQRSLLLILSFLSGFLILSFEVAAIEVVMLVAPLSFHAPAIVLIGFILILGFSAAFTNLITAYTKFLPLVLILAGLATLLSAPIFYFVANYFHGLPPQDGFTAFWTKLLFLSLVAFGPAIFIAGLVFPLISLEWSRCQAHSEASQQNIHDWGWLLAVNGAGGFLGAEVGYRILMPQVGLYPSIGVIAVAYCFVAIFLLLRGFWRGSNRSVGLSGAVAIVCLWIVVSYFPALPTLNPHLGWKVLEQRSGPEGTIAVVEGRGLERGILVSNQYLLGSVGARWDQERLGQLPLLLHPEPKRVAFLGIATGMTPGAVTQFKVPEQMVAFEISQTVKAFADRHFSEYNNDLIANPRIQTIREDARIGMLASRNDFDLIIGDLFLPWGPGEARLYSLEHFRTTKRALRMGGMFAQWLPLYQLSLQQLGDIIATFEAVFPNTEYFLGGLSLGQPKLLMVGSDGAALSWNTVQERIEQEKTQLKDPLMRHAEGVQMLYLGSQLNLPQGNLNTLENMSLEILASRQRIVQQPDDFYLSGQTLIEWLNDQDLPEFFSTWSLPLLERYWQQMTRSRRPDSDAQVPAALRSDQQADWARWSGPRLPWF